MKIKTGLCYLYLVAFSYCEEVKRTINTPLIDSFEEYTTPDLQLVEYTGNTNCTYPPQEHFVFVNGTTIQVADPSGKNICDRYLFLQEAHTQLSSLELLDKRFIPNPEIFGFSIRVVGVTVAHGTVSLATLATVGALAATIVLVWFGAKALFADKTVPVQQNGISRRLMHSPSLLHRRSAKTLDVCYADDPVKNHYVQNAVKDDGKPNIDVVAATCMQMIEKKNKDATVGTCAVELMGTDGSDYDAVIGAATPGKSTSSALKNMCHYQKY